MNREVECMCMNCGVSVYLSMSEVILEDTLIGEYRMVRNCFCSECGGQLAMIGSAGEQPHYRLE
jgi:hypothetical protein